MLPVLPLAISLLLGLVSANVEEVPKATASCGPIAGKGRIRCSLELESSTEIRWAEFIVREAPRFAEPLRGRTGPLEAVSRSNSHWKWEFAFAGLGKGEGSALIEVRSVQCAGSRPEDPCRPNVLSIRMPLRVD